MTDPEPADAYYRAIEEEFLRRRGAPMLLSPRDWSLIGEWREARVPLPIVLQGIANVFDAYARRPRTARRINSLSYCRQEVLGLHEIWLGLRGAEAGRPATDAGPSAGRETTVRRYLGRLARRLREAMAISSEGHLDPLVAALARAAAELRSMRSAAGSGGLAPADLEQRLRRLDDEILEAALRSLPGEEVRQAEAEAEAALADERRRMASEAFAATRRLHVARRIRTRCRLPRLTLFD